MKDDFVSMNELEINTSNHISHYPIAGGLESILPNTILSIENYQLFLDLLNNMLILDKTQRYTASQLMNHELFKEISQNHESMIYPIPNEPIDMQDIEMASVYRQILIRILHSDIQKLKLDEPTTENDMASNGRSKSRAYTPGEEPEMMDMSEEDNISRSAIETTKMRSHQPQTIKRISKLDERGIIIDHSYNLELYNELNCILSAERRVDMPGITIENVLNESRKSSHHPNPDPRYGNAS